MIGNMKALFFILSVVSFSGALAQTEKPVIGRVYFKNLKDGQTVPSKIKVEFGLEGLGVRPALEDPNDKTTGHHHLIINGGPIRAGEVIPTDENHIHFGKGQTSAEIELKKRGLNTLTLQFADGAHRSYGEKLSKTIQVRVK